jgi:hypothetical protein
MNTIRYNDVILWAILKDWPKIPDNLLLDISNYNNDELQYEGKGLRVGHYKDIKYKNSLYKRWPLLSPLSTWIEENIPCNFNQVGIQKIEPVIEKTKLLAHCDKEPRRWTILYILDLGGEGIFTNFYQEEDKPILREYGDVANDYNSLVNIGSIKFEKCTWVLLNGLVMHDVDHLKHSRISITGSIWSLDDIKHF